MLPMPTSASSSSTGRPASARQCSNVRWASIAVVALAEHDDLADSRVGVDLERDVLRHGDHEASDADVRVDGRGAVRERDGAEVEVEVADAELVARLERGKVAGCSCFSPTPDEIETGVIAAIPNAASRMSPRKTSPPTRRRVIAPTTIAAPTIARPAASATARSTS